MSFKSKKDQRLERYMDEACRAMLAALPNPSELKYEFSDEFTAKAEKFLQKLKHRKVLRRHVRNVAAIFLVLVVGAGAFLGLNGEVRANFFTWVRAVYENSIIYRFTGETDDATLPTCELMWVPDGYELISREQDEDSLSFVYENEASDVFIFECYQIAKDEIMQLMPMNNNNIKRVSVNGLEGNLCLATDGSNKNDLIWMENNQGFVYAIDASNMEEAVILHIAENVNITK